MVEELDELEGLQDIYTALPADTVISWSTRSRFLQFLNWLFRANWMRQTVQVNAPKSWQEIPLQCRMDFLRHLLHWHNDYAWHNAITKWLHDKGIPMEIMLMQSVFTSERWLQLRYHFRHLALENINGSVPMFTRFTVQKTEFQLIQDGFTDGCIYEYARATDYHKAILSGKQEQLLHFLAVVCRPVVGGKPQSLQHIGAVNERIKILSKLDQLDQSAYAFAALRHFEACQQFIYDKWHPIFEKPKDSEPNGEAATMDLGWDGQMMSMSENITKLKEVQQTNVHTFCYWLLKKKTDDDAYRRTMENAGLKTD